MTLATRTIEPGDEIFDFDSPEVEAFSRRACRRLQSLRDVSEEDYQDEEEEEDEPVEETILPDEPYEPDEELQDQAALAEFFNMRFQPTPNTGDLENHSKLDEDACTPLFEGSRVSKLTAILLLSNLQQKYNVSNSFMDSLYASLAKHLLPGGNVLPDSHRSARRMMSSVGLDYQMIRHTRDNMSSEGFTLVSSYPPAPSYVQMSITGGSHEMSS
ncbi:hypothetical protein R1sor_009927 [Riccia sorocarpa]|uniref:MAGE domain-containing protein n=1 Tax=Riccia sorocarpa TaxID=122646 RepID=A0ABD3HXY3_9MARC